MFSEYLKSTKAEFTNNLKSYPDIHIVLGNESCDLDSTVSSLALAYFLDRCKIPQIPNSALIIPILNASYENFQVRTLNCFALRKCGISLDSLIYRNEIDIEKLLETNQVTTTLVDHHVLSKNDQALQLTVVQIFDHRPLDARSRWINKNIKSRIEEVGSCSTLIADEILQIDESILNKELGYLLYETIIYDTIALLVKNGRTKELDITVAKKLEGKFGFNEGRTATFDKLRAIDNSVVQLSADEILLKDLKFVENIPIPSLQILAEDFFKLNDGYNAIKSMACQHKAPLIVLVGIDSSKIQEVRRDVALFWTSDGEGLKHDLLAKLRNSQDLKGYDFEFDQTSTISFTDAICLRQRNITLSRKQIIPIVRDLISEKM